MQSLYGSYYGVIYPIFGYDNYVDLLPWLSCQRFDSSGSLNIGYILEG
jgi:hypothetical protein